jgi:hypothetical protein
MENWYKTMGGCSIISLKIASITQNATLISNRWRGVTFEQRALH